MKQIIEFTSNWKHRNMLHVVGGFLMYVKNDFINPEEQDEAKRVCVFGLKPNEFEILK